MNDTQKVVVAASAGAVIGALAGVLFAPAKGTETREQIASKAGDVKDSLTDMVEKGKSAIADMTQKGVAAVKKEVADSKA